MSDKKLLEEPQIRALEHYLRLIFSEDVDGETIKLLRTNFLRDIDQLKRGGYEIDPTYISYYDGFKNN